MYVMMIAMMMMIMMMMGMIMMTMGMMMMVMMMIHSFSMYRPCNQYMLEQCTCPCPSGPST